MITLLLLIIFSQILYRALSKTNTDLATPLPLSQLFQMSGAASNDNFGVSVSNAGDFNNDGIDDIIVGSYMSDPFTRSNAGLVYVIYGKQNGMKANADLSVPLSLSEGFWVAGCSPNDYLGTSVNPAGDVNKDGVDDIIIGANASPPSSDGGAAYVIFGKAGGSPGNLDLCNGLTQTQGFIIIGAVMGGLVGQSVNGAGDVNGDGYADVIVGGSKITPANGITSAGIAVVVYGKATAMIGDINLASTLPLSQGFLISGGAVNGQLGFSVSSAGDINKDGYDDIIVGIPYCQTGATIIYGKPTGMAANIDLSASLPLSQGFQILSVGPGDRLGRSVSKAGDFNNDGIDDIIVGANLANSPNTGAAYVIYGKAGGMTSNINLNSLTLSQGFSIQGAAGGDNAGYSVSYAGDVNKDNIDDVIIGAPGNSPSGRSGAGSAYIIYGKTGGMNANIDLSTPLIITQGFTVSGGNSGDNLGFSVSAAGDFNNDGIDDIIVGGHAASPLGRSGAGSAYVLYDPPYCSTLYCVTCAGSKCLTCATDYLLYVGDGKCYTEYTCPSGTTPNATNCVDHLMESVGKAQGLASQGAALAASAISLVSFSNPVGLLFNSLAGILLYMKYMSITFSPRLQNILDQPDSSLLSIQYISSEPEQLDDNIPNLPLPDVFERNGFDSSFLINFWPSLINLLIICIVILIVCFAAWMARDYMFINSKCKKVKEALKWNYFLASFAGCYGPIAFYSSFQFRTIQVDSLLEILSFMICLLMNIVLLAVSVKIFIVIRTLSRSKNPRKVEKLRQKFSEYQVIFENFKSQSFSQQNYLLFSCLRFYFFYSVLGYLFDYPVIQALLINVQGIAFLFYLLIARPLKNKLDLVESIILEFIIEVVHACVLGFAVINHQDPSSTSKAITLGDIIIIAICVFMIVECIYMLIQIIGLIINLVKFIRKAFCLSQKSGIKQNISSKPLDDSLSIDQTNDKQDTKIPSLTEKREFILPLKGAAFRRRPRNQMYAINHQAWTISSTHATT